jgi:hypothetical protein
MTISEQQSPSFPSINLFAFECRIMYCGQEFRQTVKATTASKARYKFYKHNFDDEKYSDLFKYIRSSSLGKCAIGSYIENEELERFERVKAYRNVPFAYIGMSVVCDGKPGIIVGANHSSNFDVDFGRGIPCNCHPTWRMTYYDRNGDVVQSFENKRTES